MTFEEGLPVINKELAKRKHKWMLKALPWFGYEDVEQIIRIHIFKKWHLYDQTRPLAHWVNSIITSQIRNIIRNNYSNFSRPCLKCPAFEGENLCAIYQVQCTECPWYAKWVQKRKAAYDTKLPLPLENHSLEVGNIICNAVDVERKQKILTEKLRESLKPREFSVYNMLFVKNWTEERVAEKLGFITTESNRKAGYKQIQNFKRKILEEAKKIIYTDMEL